MLGIHTSPKSHFGPGMLENTNVRDPYFTEVTFWSWYAEKYKADRYLNFTEVTFWSWYAGKHKADSTRQTL